MMSRDWTLTERRGLCWDISPSSRALSRISHSIPVMPSPHSPPRPAEDKGNAMIGDQDSPTNPVPHQSMVCMECADVVGGDGSLG